VKASAHLGAYRRLTALYPRRFRQEYREDMVELFRHQLEDSGPVRVWLGTAKDIVITVPARHLEAHMQRPGPRLVTAGAGVIAAAATMLSIVIGTSASLPLLLVAAVAATVSYWSWHANRPIQVAGTVERAWWKFLVGGAALAAITFSAIAIPWPDAIDLGENAYWLVIFSIMTAVALGATGAGLGIAALFHRKTPPGTVA
jgi:hypothetical protein